ncbi:MAG: BglI family type II restriction endonuclease [Anaerolineae bacterium]|nr:BglI family type II restriction endonuclease [Anaerolineae bacterium]
MQRSDFTTIQEFAEYIAQLEKDYTERLFHALYKNAGNIQAWYNEPNKVPETWVGKMVISPREPSAPWEQVGEIVIVGVVNREFPEWFPVGLPIGSETRLSTPDAIVHIDVKTHKEGDPDLDRTQDVRPEQISTDEDETHVQNSRGQLGDSPPKLPPYYVFGPNLLKVTVSAFVICAYQFDEAARYQYLTRLQLFTVPNGILRAVRDYTDIFRAGKDGRGGHRYRINLPALAGHESWRWREIRYLAQGFEVTR